MEVTTLTDITQEPVSLEMAANWCKIPSSVALGAPGDRTPEGQVLELLVATAREWCEKYTGLSFGPKTLEVRLSQTTYQGPHNLPYGPNQSVLSAADHEGNEIPLEQFGSTWYAEYLKGMSVNNTYKEDYGYGYGLQSVGYFGPDTTYTITYETGFAEGKLPAALKQAVLKTVLELYNNRENSVIGTTVAELPLDAKALLDPYRTKVLF